MNVIYKDTQNVFTQLCEIAVEANTINREVKCVELNIEELRQLHQEGPYLVGCSLFHIFLNQVLSGEVVVVGSRIALKS